MEKPLVRVLLIEDDEDDYVIVRDILEEIEAIDFKIEWVSTYREGLDGIINKNYDAYLLDYRLGDKDGLDLLREAKRRDGNSPIIFLTGLGDYEVDLAAMESGASDYLVKDQLTPELLERSIRYAINWRRTEGDLLRSREQQKQLSAKLLRAQESERKKVARTIHDSLGQALTAIPFALDESVKKLSRQKDVEYCAKTLESVREMVGQIQLEVQRIQQNLRPPMIDTFGIIDTIRWFVEKYDEIYPAIDVVTELTAEEAQVPEALKIVIFRVVQESLNNIAKHSGASRAIIALNSSDGRLTLLVQDNGAGFQTEENLENPALRSLGLMSMKERVEDSGGKFFIASQKDEGTSIRAEWPAQAAAIK